MPPPDVDVASIVPSTRDFLQSIATQRRRLALVPLVDGPEDARKLCEAGIGAFAVAAPGEAMRAVAAAVGSSPVLSLAPLGGADEALAARASGADAVIAPPSAWAAVSTAAASTHMAALVAATDRASAEVASKTAARAVYLAIAGLPELGPAMAKLGARCTVAHLPSADEATLRALRGVVDAAIIGSDLYLSTSFATLREELDP